MDSQDLENGIEEGTDLFSTLFDAFKSFIELLPSEIIGGIIFALISIAVYHWAKGS